jgi:rhodanese-related sulfurtransferase
MKRSARKLKDQKIILYYRTDRRSGLALEALKKRVFTEVENYRGIDDALAHLKKKRKNSADHLASF